MFKKLKNDIDHDIWSLLKGFDPKNNLIDQKLLYMITGRGKDKCVIEAEFIYSEKEDDENILNNSGKASIKSSYRTKLEQSIQ